MMLWTNVHGGFIAGLLLIAIYAAGECGQWLFSDDSSQRKNSRARALLFGQALALCAIVTLVNPYGYGLHQHLLSYLTDGYQLANIAEFQSISFHHPLSRAFEALFFLGCAAALLNLARGRFTHFLILTVWGHLALVSTRNIPIFVIVATPLIAVALQNCLLSVSRKKSWLRWPGAAHRFARFCAGITELETVPRWHAVSIATLALLGAILFAPSPPPRFASNYDIHEYPERAMRTLQDAGGMGRIFSTDVWGGYLIYRMYPQVKVFVDGRSDFYGPTFSEAYTDVMNVKPGWEERLRKHGIQTILVPPASFLSGALKESRNWRCTYDDGVAIVFRPVIPIPANDKQVSSALASGGRSRKVVTTVHPISSGKRPPNGLRT